jgi:hypothetical protein
MAENHTSKAKSKNKVIALVAVFAAVILVAAFVGAYYLLPSNSGQTPTSEVVHNFSDGAWANYAITSYDDAGVAKGHGVENSTVTAGTCGEKTCWIYSGNFVFIYNNGTVVNQTMTYYYDKSNYATLQMSSLSYVNGELADNTTLGPNDAGFEDDDTFYGDLNVTATNQSVSVPAGTFQCTVREGPDPDTGMTYTLWASKDVPAWGEVKSQYSNDGLVLCIYTLESYGYQT